MTKLNAGESCGFVGESLKQLRASVGNQAAVMGFVGAPFTLATYIVEGARVALREGSPRSNPPPRQHPLPSLHPSTPLKLHPNPPPTPQTPQNPPNPQPGGSSKNFAHIKRLAFGEPAVLHALLDKLADNVADYCRYQVGCLWWWWGGSVG